MNYPASRSKLALPFFEKPRPLEGSKNIFLGLEKAIRKLAGQYFDGETGLHYNFQRYYDPETGRYFREDPLGLMGGINPFLYAKANPLERIDPYGTCDYSGHCTYQSGGEILGVGVLKCKFKTRCNESGWYDEGETTTLFIGFTVGVLPYGFTQFDVCMESETEDKAIADLRGPRAYIISEGAAAGIGLSAGELKLGKAKSNIAGGQAGLDVPNADAFIGGTKIENVVRKACPAGCVL